MLPRAAHKTTDNRRGFPFGAGVDDHGCPDFSSCRAIAWPIPSVEPVTRSLARKINLHLFSMPRYGEQDFGKSRYSLLTVPVALKLADDLHPGYGSSSRLDNALYAEIMRL